jgi:hypothetical protein
MRTQQTGGSHGWSWLGSISGNLYRLPSGRLEEPTNVEEDPSLTVYLLGWGFLFFNGSNSSRIQKGVTIRFV